MVHKSGMPKPIVALILASTAAGLVVGLIGCPSLSALECQGAACADGGGGASDAGGALGIGCGGGTSCVVPAQECCIPSQG